MQLGSDFKGIISVVQTPFTNEGQIDFESLQLLVVDSIKAGVDGLLAPVMASEVTHLSLNERIKTITEIIKMVPADIPVIAGASSESVSECRQIAMISSELGAEAYLVAVPNQLYHDPDTINTFFNKICKGIEIPLIVQDFEINGQGMELDTIFKLKQSIQSFVGIKIETTPAGPKYTKVREKLGNDFFIAGGWAVQQFIEALDRGIDAMIPESSMIRVYKRILHYYKEGNRDAAKTLFNRLLPILAFTNQDIGNSIFFFKHLLVAKKIFRTTNMRWPEPEWDEYSFRVVEELIDLYLELEENEL